MVKRILAVLSLLFALAIGACAQKAPAPMTFDVATIRPAVKDSETLKFEAVGTTGLTGNHLSVLFLIQFAYELKPYEVDIPKGLGWIDTTEFDINAKAATDHPLSYEELKPMVQNLLEERFHLKFHRGTREMKGYDLVVAKGGSKLVTTSEHAKMSYIMQNGIQMTGVNMDSLAAVLAHPLGQPVVDKTGLQGNYEIKLKYAPQNPTNNAADNDLPSLFTALEEQAGLHLEPARVSVSTLVVDSADKTPTNE